MSLQKVRHENLILSLQIQTHIQTGEPMILVSQTQIQIFESPILSQIPSTSIEPVILTSTSTEYISLPAGVEPALTTNNIMPTLPPVIISQQETMLPPSSSSETLPGLPTQINGQEIRQDNEGELPERRILILFFLFSIL